MHMQTPECAEKSNEETSLQKHFVKAHVDMMDQLQKQVRPPQLSDTT